MRAKLKKVNINIGDYTASAEDQDRLFMLYSQNMQKRISTHDLEETVFHESVHATLDQLLKLQSEWKQAQMADPGYITRYAQNNPVNEDMSESALFAWTMNMHPG